ncbi:MAG: aminotransferase class V-fold PLP-dependent enzyme [Anaerolineae bacterium]|nr:aminotransferase class V-fold PLP-dependent enzyme [Anaerolineae bacterium]
MPAFDLEQIRRDFPIVQSRIYANHAAVGPVPLSVRAAVLECLDDLVYDVGSAWARSEPVFAEGRALAARLVNSQPDRIAWVQNTSHGVSLIAAGLGWQPGDNVLVPDNEFPSNYFAWKALADRGVELRHIPSVEGRILPESIRPLIDRRTRVVALSQVQYYNGFQCDIRSIGELCRDSSVLLVVDGTQSIGAMTLDIARSYVDVLLVAAHKWMLGPFGVGFMALSDRALEAVSVTSIGWLSFREPFIFVKDKQLLPDASRFEPGTKNSIGLYGLLARLRAITELGAEVIEGHVLALTDQFCAALPEIGCQCTSYRGAGEKSGIVTFRHPDIPSEALMEQLNRASIDVSVRAGSVRFSPHYYNSEAEIEQVLTVLAAIIRERV